MAAKRRQKHGLCHERIWAASCEKQGRREPVQKSRGFHLPSRIPRPSAEILCRALCSSLVWVRFSIHQSIPMSTATTAAPASTQLSQLDQLKKLTKVCLLYTSPSPRD